MGISMSCMGVSTGIRYVEGEGWCSGGDSM
jgi:hypothetical protein